MSDRDLIITLVWVGIGAAIIVGLLIGIAQLDLPPAHLARPAR